MSNRHVSHGNPTCIHLPKLGGTSYFYNILLSDSDLPTVRQFLLKQTQLKCVMFGKLKGAKTDVIDTVKVLKCYSGIAT